MENVFIIETSVIQWCYYCSNYLSLNVKKCYYRIFQLHVMIVHRLTTASVDERVSSLKKVDLLLMVM